MQVAQEHDDATLLEFELVRRHAVCIPSVEDVCGP